jgi:ABC-type spermidine/putrescine transport system permease subunit II
MSYQDTARRTGWSAVAIGVYAVLLIPIVVIVLTSFTFQPFPTIPEEGVTLRWYAEVFSRGQILSALGTSFLTLLNATQRRGGVH